MSGMSSELGRADLRRRDETVFVFLSQVRLKLHPFVPVELQSFEIVGNAPARTPAAVPNSEQGGICSGGDVGVSAGGDVGVSGDDILRPVSGEVAARRRLRRRLRGSR